MPNSRLSPTTTDNELRLLGPVELTLEASATEGEPQAARVRVDAYGGGLMTVSGYGRVVIDLDGLEAADRVPLLADHDNSLDAILGSGQPVRADGKLAIAGTLVRNHTRAQRVIDLHRDGVPLQASVGAEPLEVERIAKGKQAVVNGRTVRAEHASFLLVKRARLKHVAIVANGADHGTGIDIAAAAEQQGDLPVEFTQWLQAKSFDPAQLSEEQIASLKAMFDAERVKAEPSVADVVAQAKAELAADAKRIAAIQRIFAGTHPDLEAQAIDKDWDENKARLAKLRAVRPEAPMPARDTQDRFPHNAVLEAGFALRRCTFSNLEKHYKPELLEAAEKAFGPGGLCLREMIGEIAEANGYTGSKYIDSRNIETAMDFAWKAPLQAAGSSTLSLRNILSNLANKEKLDAFTEEDATWRQIAIVKSVSDLKEVTSHRLLDDMEYEELSPDGEIKHGELSEEMYTHQAHTYAKMFTLTRTHIINDNLGALDDVRTRLGAGAARKLNTVFWSTFLNNAAHFTAARGNFISGATTNLGLDGVGLQAGVLAFSKLQSADGKRIGGNPEILLIPPELKVIADMLYQSTNVNTGGSSTKDTVPNANIPAGKYTPVVSPWLSEASFAGNSATAWYLLRKPSIHAAVVVSFLNGVQVPTVEVADSDFNKLGIQFRGYFDFGVNLREPLAGIKSKGAA